MAEVLFYGSALLIVLVVAGFPLLLWLRAQLAPRPIAAGDSTPSVSVIIAAFNEQRSIGVRLENLLQADYPAERLEVIVGSDGSTDATEEICRRFADRGVRVLPLERRGKGHALNAAVAAARGDILVFTDANTEFSKDALRALVSPFADPQVGGVAGNQVYRRPHRPGATGCGECTYWDWDRWIKTVQSKGGSITSATGAIYAIRRPLYEPIPPGVMDDYTVSTGVIAHGQRLVFAPSAIAYEPVASSAGIEFSRKVRIMVQGLRAVWHRRSLLNPFTSGFYAFQLIWHKVARRLLVVPLFILLVTSVSLYNDGWVYRSVALAQAVWCMAAAAGWLLRETRWARHKVVAIPVYSTVVLTASLVALWQLARREPLLAWNPERHQQGAGRARSKVGPEGRWS